MVSVQQPIQSVSSSGYLFWIETDGWLVYLGDVVTSFELAGFGWLLLCTVFAGFCLLLVFSAVVSFGCRCKF